MQGLRNLRRRMPLRRDRDGAGDDLRRPRPALLDHVDLFSGLGIGGHLLINTRRKYSDLGLGDYVNRVANRARISRPVTPHVLRHTFSVTVIQRGISLPSLQRLLGHDHLGTIQIYLNLSPEEVIREFNEKW